MKLSYGSYFNKSGEKLAQDIVAKEQHRVMAMRSPMPIPKNHKKPMVSNGLLLSPIQTQGSDNAFLLMALSQAGFTLLPGISVNNPQQRLNLQTQFSQYNAVNGTNISSPEDVLTIDNSKGIDNRNAFRESMNINKENRHVNLKDKADKTAATAVITRIMDNKIRKERNAITRMKEQNRLRNEMAMIRATDTIDNAIKSLRQQNENLVNPSKPVGEESQVMKNIRKQQQNQVNTPVRKHTDPQEGFTESKATEPQAAPSPRNAQKTVSKKAQRKIDMQLRKDQGVEVKPVDVSHLNKTKRKQYEAIVLRAQKGQTPTKKMNQFLLREDLAISMNL